MAVNKSILKTYGNHYSNKDLNNLARSMNNKLGDRAPIIAMEELSELIQATSKWLRFDFKNSNNPRYADDRFNIVEEIADATIAINIIKHMAQISQDEINQMISYKIDRDFNLLNNGAIVSGKNRK